MIEFHKISLADKPLVDKLMIKENSQSADYNFTNLYIWSSLYHQKIADIQDFLAVYFDCGKQPYYCFPIGGDVKAAICSLKADADSRSESFLMKGVTEAQKEKLEQFFPECFVFTEDTYANDYIYLAEKLDTLSGKKMNGKRNHINHFLKEYSNWNIEPITSVNLSECIYFQNEWRSAHGSGESNMEAEQIAIQLVTDHYSQLNLEGIILRAEGRMLGFTIGELINDNTYNVHFEKANPEIQGAYPMLNREFVRYIRQLYPQVEYINREDDVGLENLRKAKRSYYSDHMVVKYSARWAES